MSRDINELESWIAEHPIKSKVVAYLIGIGLCIIVFIILSLWDRVSY